MASPTTGPRTSRPLSHLTTLLLPIALAVAMFGAPVAGSAGGPTVQGSGDASAAPLRLVAGTNPSPTLRTFTLNVCFCLNKTKARADLRRAMRTLGDVGGFQEMSQAEDRASLMEVAKAEDWGWYMPTDGGEAIPIVWDRQRFRLIEGRTIKVHGPEDGVTPSRYINSVRLRELSSGKVFGFINTHVISGASRDAQLSNMKRIPRLRLHLELLRGEIKRLFTQTEHVFISGDLNVNYLADRRRKNPGLPTDRLGDLVNFDMPNEGSFNPTSLLDYGMTVKNDGGLRRTGAAIVKGFNSDHSAIAFTYRVLDLFETGPVLNRPDGNGYDKRRVLDRVVRAVQGAESGATIRVATARLGYTPLYRALRDAHARGVGVQVVLGDGESSRQEVSMLETLGADRTSSSWIMRCAGSCLGGNGETSTNFVTVDATNGTPDLTLVSSTAFTGSSKRRWTDVYRNSSSKYYAGLNRIFTRLAADTIDNAPRRRVRWGSHRTQLYPVPNVERRDPVLMALDEVGCTRARGLRTGDGRTNVRAVVGQWAGGRGKRIATALADLNKDGCDVAIVAGPNVKNGIRRILKRAGVPLRTASVEQNLLVIDGRIGKRRGSRLAQVGGPVWTTRGLGSDGAEVMSRDKTAVSAYLDGFSAAFQHG